MGAEPPAQSVWDTQENRTTVCLVGDVNLQDREDPAVAFDGVAPTLAAADCLLGNLEGCLYEPGSEDIPGKEGWQHSEASMVDGLVAAGFDAIGCANNVVYGDEAIRNTLRTLEDHSIAHCGAGETLQAARAPVSLDVGGSHIGFVQRTARLHHDAQAATADSPGVAYFDPDAPAHLDRLASTIDEIAAEHDHTVFTYHLRQTTDRAIEPYQRRVARRAIDAGADIVVGHGAHVNQGIEAYEGAPIFHCIGQLAFDWGFAREYTDGLIVRLAIDDGEIADVAFVPVSRDEDNDVYVAPPGSPAGDAQIVDIRERSSGVALEVTEQSVAVEPS